MTIDYEKLMAFRVPDAEATYTVRDTILYALAVGLGSDPTDDRELAFVLEDRLRVVPTMSTVLAWDDAWLYETGVDMLQQVHGEQRTTIVRPLPPAATVVARRRIVDVVDKGPGRGALLVFETRIHDRATDELFAIDVATSFARGDGGFGGPRRATSPPHAIPDRPADTVVEARTLPQQALLYRLSGDRNPLHAEPAYARAAGFPRPILHGLCTYGHACAAVVRTFAGWDPERLRELSTRFTSPVYPGETLRTELWRDGAVVSFRTRALERDLLVLDHGKAVLSAA